MYVCMYVFMFLYVHECVCMCVCVLLSAPVCVSCMLYVRIRICVGPSLRPQHMTSEQRIAVITHCRQSIELSRNVHDPSEIRRLLTTGRWDLDRLKTTVWMAR